MSLRLTDESILRLEAARDRQRQGHPPSPAPAPVAEPTPAPQQQVSPPPPPPPPLPEGSVVLSAGEWEAVAHLIETHPQTRDTYHRAEDKF